MERKRACHEACFHYDPRMQGCSFTRMDFEGREAVGLGQPCLHPESFDEKLYEASLLGVCTVLGRGLVA